MDNKCSVLFLPIANFIFHTESKLTLICLQNFEDMYSRVKRPRRTRQTIMFTEERNTRSRSRKQLARGSFLPEYSHFEKSDVCLFVQRAARERHTALTTEHSGHSPHIDTQSTTWGSASQRCSTSRSRVRYKLIERPLVVLFYWFESRVTLKLLCDKSKSI